MHFGNQRGYALMTVLVLLVALGFVGAGAAIMTATDTRVSGLLAFSNRAGAASHAGLEHAVAHFLTHGPVTGWPVTGTVNGYAYAVTVEADSFDFGLGLVPVHWSITAGINGLADGEAVWLLTSTASRRNVRASQQLRITGQRLHIETEAAFTANSNIRLEGNITISGINHASSGSAVNPSDTSFTGACNENKPAILLTSASDSVQVHSTSLTLDGNATFAPSHTRRDSTTIWHSPEAVLGLPEGALDGYKQSGSQYYANPPDSVSGIIYVTDDYGSKVPESESGQLNGTGVLIIHNPYFNPREHDPDDPLYDPVKASDPKYAPANLGNINGGEFHGIIIADRVDKINGNVKIYGSVVSLTEIDVNIIGAGTAQIRYSCESIQAVSNTLVAPRRLAWMAD